MSLVGKVVRELEIKAAAHKLYNIFKDQCSIIPNMSPKCIQKVEVEGEGDGNCHGTIVIWNYTVDGKAEVFKERMELDDTKLMVSLIGLEGDVFKFYKTFKAIMRFVPKGVPEHSLTILTVEYEKHNDGFPCPYKYLDLMNNIIKDIESHLKK